MASLTIWNNRAALNALLLIFVKYLLVVLAGVTFHSNIHIRILRVRIL